MRSFISNELEPLAYFMYMGAVLLYYNRHKAFRHSVLVFYYAGAAIVLYAGIAIKAYYNNWTYNIVYLANICIFSWYFRQLLYSFQKKKIVVICFVINVLIFIYFNVVLNRFYSNFNSFVYGVVFMSIVLYTLLYLHQTLATIKEENLLLNFDFWLVCSYLLHFLGSFIVVIFYEGANMYKRADIWAIQNIILFICSAVTLTAAFRINKKQYLINNG